MKWRYKLSYYQKKNFKEKNKAYEEKETVSYYNTHNNFNVKQHDRDEIKRIRGIHRSEWAWLTSHKKKDFLVWLTKTQLYGDNNSPTWNKLIQKVRK